VTFGSLVSHDRGKTWSWVCEKSIGSAGVEDPMYAFTPNGTVIATTFQGLSVSKDKECTFGFFGAGTGDPLKGLVLVDLASRPNDRKGVVVLASAYDTLDDAGNILFKSQLFETKDEAITFLPLTPDGGGAGASVLDPSALGTTIDVAATDPERLYASAVRDPGTKPVGLLLSSKDHGQSWTTVEVPLTEQERSIYIAGVDPKNADRLYVRTYSATDRPSRILVSDDAGKTFKQIFQGAASLPGFALSPDGSKIYIGGPLDGVQVASTTDFAFTARAKFEVGCLALSADGLWACSNEKSGFVAGLSKDDGATFQAVLHFCDITGPLACPPGTPTNDLCSKDWPVQRGYLGCNAVTDGSTGDGGETNDTPIGGGGGSCNCGFAPASSFAAGATGAIAIALLARLRRRRRAR
jgi:MYXO-CTERM domain-containing protein